MKLSNIICVVEYDMVTERIASLTIFVKSGDDSILSTLAADVYLAINEEADETREEAIASCNKWINYCKPLKGGGFSGVEMDDEFRYGCIQGDNLETVDNIAFRLDAAWAPTYYWP